MPIYEVVLAEVDCVLFSFESREEAFECYRIVRKIHSRLYPQEHIQLWVNATYRFKLI